MADVSVRDHDYHLVEPSRWPFVGSLAAFIMAVGGVFAMHGYGWYETCLLYTSPSPRDPL